MKAVKDINDCYLILKEKQYVLIILEQTTKSWLYSGGHPVTCNRGMEIAAIITAINPSATATINSQEVVELQRYPRFY